MENARNTPSRPELGLLKDGKRHKKGKTWHWRSLALHSYNPTGRKIAMSESILIEGEIVERKAEKIIGEWLEDRDAMKAADAAEKRSAGKPNIAAKELYKQCGL